MAVLGKIREKSMLLIVIIALGLFAFVVDPTTIINLVSGTQNKDYIGKVDGETIDRIEFANEVNFNRTYRYRPGTANNIIVNALWDQKVSGILFGEQMDKLGISIESDELRDVIIQSSQSNPMFQTEGVFDESLLNNWIAQRKEQDLQAWIAEEENYSKQQREFTFYNLVRAGIGATEKDGEQKYRLENDQVTMRFAQAKFASIADSLVNVSNEEIVAYMNKNYDKFEIDAGTDIKYVLFKDDPSAEDQAKARAELDEIVELFKKDSVSNAAEFVRLESSIPYDSVYKLQAQVFEPIRDSIFTMEIGELTDVYTQNEFIQVSKVTGFQDYETRKTSQVIISHKDATNVPEGVNRTKEEAEQLANELMRDIKNGTKEFDAVAKELSADPGAQSRGADFGLQPKEFTKEELREFVFENGKLDEFKVIESDLGYHVVKITEIKMEKKVQLATVAKKVEAGKDTLDKLYRDAQSFEIDADKEGANFDQLAQEKSLQVGVVNNMGELAERLTGVEGDHRGIVRWTYDEANAIGDVERFDYPNGHIVVQLVDRRAKGLPSVDKASINILPILRNEKKAAIIRERSAGAISVDDFAQKNNTNVQVGTPVSMNAPQLTGAGTEAKVVGTAFGMNEGQTSGMIDGKTGVFMIEVTKLTPAPDQTSYKKFADETTRQNNQALLAKIYEALKKKSEIEDNRADVY